LEYFVFSDDVANVRKSLNETETEEQNTLHFVSGGSNSTSSLDDFILMTLFSHLIISNSTFSWWAAYLSHLTKNKIVIGPTFHPKFYDHYENLKEREFKRKVIGSLWYPPSWIVINPYTDDS